MDRRLLHVNECGPSIEPRLGESMHCSSDFFDEHFRRAPLLVRSPTPDQARAHGLRPEYRATIQEASTPNRASSARDASPSLG